MDLGGTDPLVSVVIPTYNGEQYIGETIGSVLGQTFESWELVVYDDGSTDATVEVAREKVGLDPRVTVIAGSNGGVAQARNAGFALTDQRTSYVIFLDHDDVWNPEMLQTLVGVLDVSPEYVAAHAIATCIDENGQQPVGDDLEEYMSHRAGFRDGRLRPIEPTEPTTFADFVYSNWIVTPGTLLVRRAIATSVGGFDRDVTPADDWDMAVRVSRLGDVGYVGRPLLRWRRHSGAQSYASPDYGRAHLRVRHKMLADVSNSAAQLSVARQAFVHISRVTVRYAGKELADRNLRASARQGVKTVWQCGWYARSEVTRWCHRRPRR
jgi:glycosyltransferase involved in cell wall biosynthesis